MTLNIDDLLVSQEAVEAAKIRSMKEFVTKGGIWKAEIFKPDAYTRHGKEGLLSPLIALTRFEDGTLLIQNGHHRCRATREIRSFLYDDEYLISDRITGGYLEVNFERTFVTPFDPITEIRLHDFHLYKRKVLELAATDPEQALKYIQEHPSEYKKPRTIYRVMEMQLLETGRENFSLLGG